MQGLIVALGLTLTCLGVICLSRSRPVRQPAEKASLLAPILLADVLDDELLRLLDRAGGVADDSASSALRKAVILGQMVYVSRGGKDFIVRTLDQCLARIESGEVKSGEGLEEEIDAARAALQRLLAGAGESANLSRTAQK
jgi:hypothetical protein